MRKNNAAADTTPTRDALSGRSLVRRHLAVAVAALTALGGVSALGAIGSAAAAPEPDDATTGLAVPAEVRTGTADAEHAVLIVTDDTDSTAAAATAVGSDDTDTLDASTVSASFDADELAAATAALEARPDVTAVVLDEPQGPAQQQWDPAPHPASASIGAPAGWPDAGTGRTIAVLDTGVSRTNPATANKIVAAACFSTAPAAGYTPACAGDGAAAGDPCTFAGCTHGTAIAGVAGGALSSTAPWTRAGVAPGANLAAVQVFSRYDGAGCPDGCPAAFASDIIAALNWLADNHDEMGLAAVNISIGTGDGSASCAADVGGTAFRRLNDAGVAVVAAAGNAGSAGPGDPERTSWPACHPDVIATAGAHPTNDGSGDDWSNPDVRAYNAGDTIDIAAPGHNVAVPVEGGWSTASGTSVAAPAVAAAAALAHNGGAVTPAAVAAEISDGTIPDTRSSRRYPWLAVPAPTVISTTIVPTSSTTAPTTAPTTTMAPTTTTPTPANRPAFGNLERVTVNGRRVTVTGWAADADGWKPAVRITNNGVVVATVTPSRRRDDVWLFFGRQLDRDSGYSHTHTSATGDRRICVQLRDANTSKWHSTQCRTAVVK